MSDLLKARCCGMCKHAIADENGMLFCRRFPPVPTPSMQQTQRGMVSAVTSNFPPVRADWDCGEWKPRIEIPN